MSQDSARAGGRSDRAQRDRGRNSVADLVLWHASAMRWTKWLGRRCDDPSSPRLTIAERWLNRDRGHQASGCSRIKVASTRSAADRLAAKPAGVFRASGENVPLLRAIARAMIGIVGFALGAGWEVLARSNANSGDDLFPIDRPRTSRPLAAERLDDLLRWWTCDPLPAADSANPLDH